MPEDHGIDVCFTDIDVQLRPAHYGGKDNIYEAIKVIEAWDLNFSLGNALKYICRAGKKLELYHACKALLDAPHPDHFASRLSDEENAAMNRIKAEVVKIDAKKKARQLA